MFLNESIHLLYVRIVLGENTRSIDSIITRTWTTLETTEPLKCAPERRLELQCAFVAFNCLLVFELALKYVPKQIVARSTVRYAPVRLQIKMMIT